MKATLAILLLAGASTSFAYDNVALGKTVTLNGPFGTLRPGSPWSSGPVAGASTVTDGSFLAEGTQWQTGTVWWDVAADGAANNNIVIDLGGLFQMDLLKLQADDNDKYLVDLQLEDMSWTTLGYFGESSGGGMRFRQGTAGLITGRAFRLSGLDGDGYYAVSEFQAFGDAVPEPATMTILGLGALAVARRRRASK